MTESTTAEGLAVPLDSAPHPPRIVVGTDLTPLSRVAMREAARIATALHASLEVVCVYRDEFDRHWTWPALVSDDEVREHTEEVVRDVITSCGFPPDNAVVSFLQG